MAILEEILATEVVMGTAVGAGAGAVAAPWLRRLLRPAAKSLVKSGLVLYRGAASVVAEAMEPPPPARPAAPAATAGNKPSRARGKTSRTAPRKRTRQPRPSQ